MNKIQLTKFIALGMVLLSLTMACKEELPDPVTRLFMPVLNKDLTGKEIRLSSI